ncbi:hypothetical protein ACFQ69_24990 [Streptomyces sp. NPDC056470]|uniref:hypothetical protein n=1 Tax=Streptomyces sp. NPDC056470 TaxID=3345831 RepID=UPI0036A9C745
MTGPSPSHTLWHVRCRPDTSPEDHRIALDLLAGFTPLVQPLPPTAELAQVKGSLRLFGVDAVELAQQFRVRALLQTGIDTHIGVAGTWATAATASARVGRSGVLHLPDHRAVEGFLGPLPIDALHGIGPAQAQQLRAYGLHTIAALVAMDATVQRSKRLPQPSAHTEDLRTGNLRLLDAMAFQRARTRRLTLIAEDLRRADEGPGTQLSLDQARENRLRLEPVGDRINATYGRRLAGPASAYRLAS